MRPIFSLLIDYEKTSKHIAQIKMEADVDVINIINYIEGRMISDLRNGNIVLTKEQLQVLLAGAKKIEFRMT